jgi:hypothetical protein
MQVRPIALAVPVASILVTLGLAYLLKMLAAASGAEAIHLAPPTPEPARIVRKADILQGELVRGPDASGQADALIPVPSSTTSVNPQLGQTSAGQAGELSAGDPAAKRALMRMYLAEMTPAEIGRATGSSIVKAMKAIRVNVNEREARRVLDEWKAGQNGKS